MSHSAHVGILAATLALCAASIPSNAAIKGDRGALQPAVAHTSDHGGIILAAQRGVGGGARAGGGGGAAAGGRAAGGQAAAASSRQLRSSATSNVNHNANVNRNANVSRNLNANVNRDVNVNRNVEVSGNRDYYGGWDDHWHPVAAATAITATAVAVGAIVNSIPPSCSTVVVNGASYSQCGSTWYQPQYAGTSVQYVVVNPPR